MKNELNSEKETKSFVSKFNKIKYTLFELMQNKFTGSASFTVHFSQGGIGNIDKQINEVIK